MWCRRGGRGRLVENFYVCFVDMLWREEEGKEDGDGYMAGGGEGDKRGLISVVCGIKWMMDGSMANVCD